MAALCLDVAINCQYNVCICYCCYFAFTVMFCFAGRTHLTTAKILLDRGNESSVCAKGNKIKLLASLLIFYLEIKIKKNVLKITKFLVNKLG